MKAAYLLCDFVAVVKIVQCEDPLLPRVFLRHHVTLCVLYVHI